MYTKLKWKNFEKTSRIMCKPCDIVSVFTSEDHNIVAWASNRGMVTRYPRHDSSTKTAGIKQ